MNKERLLKELHDQIQRYLDQNPVRNLVMLSRDSGVAETTLRRIYNQQGAVPNPENVVRLLSFLTQETSIFALTQRFPGELSAFLREYFPLLSQEYTKEASAAPSLNEELRDFTAYAIFKRVTHKDRTTREDVLSLFGEMGRVRLDSLISKELIGQKADGTLFSHVKNFSITDPDLLKNHVAQLIQTFHKPKNAVNGGPSMLRSVSESVNAEGAAKIKRILDEATRKIYETMEAHPGGLPLMFVGAVDTLDFKEQPSQGETL